MIQFCPSIFSKFRSPLPMARLSSIPSIPIPGWPDSDESTIKFYLSPATLREISSSKIALLLWHRRFDEYSLCKITPAKWIKTHHKYFTTKDNMFIIHPAIENQIDHYMKIMGSELENWIDYHFERIFYDSDLHSVIEKCYDQMVCCGTDCTINWQATARLLLKSDRLSQVEKYRLACLYCFRDDVKRLWAMFWESQDKNVYNSTLKPVILFWNNVMMDELRAGIIQAFNGNVEKRLIAASSKYPRNWATVLYYLNRLNWLDYADQVIHLLKYDISYAIHLIPELNDVQIDRVMTECGVDILYHFASNSKYFKCALRVWSNIRHSITESTFYCTISNLLNIKTAQIQIEKDTKSPSSHEHISALLFEIWINSADNLRKYVVENFALNVLSILYEYKNEMLRIVNRDARFFLAVLSDMDFNSRNNLWQKYWSSMIFSIPPAYLNQLMILCLEDPEEILKYKKNIAVGYQIIQRYCFLSIKEGCFEDVNDFLRVCALPEEKVVAHKRDLLKSFRYHGDLIFQLKSVRKWRQFSYFVDEISANEETDAYTYKKNMIFDTSTAETLSKELINGKLWYIDRFIVTFLLAHDLIQFKFKLLDQCRRDLIRGKFYKFDACYWKEFFKWCSDNDAEKITEFRASLPIDGIFAIALRKCVKFVSINDFFRKWADDCDFNSFESFLRWYLDSTEGIRCFKLKKVYEYQGVNDLKAKLDISSGEVLEVVLRWFFDGDSSDLEQWKIFTCDSSYANLSAKRK